MSSRCEHLTNDELLRLMEPRDRRDATRFGLVWEATGIARDEAINSDFVALEAAAAVNYSWQPETLRRHIRSAHAQPEAIPESLARRFGMKG